MVTYAYSFYAEVMKFFLIATVLLFFPFKAQACEGFKNSLDALEAAVQKPQTQEKSELPHLQSLKQSLDELEKAVAQKSPQSRKPSPQTPHSVTSRNML